MTHQQDQNETRVLFRTDKSGPFKGDVTAIFPDLPGSNQFDCTCYARVGQHSKCDLAWMLEKGIIYLTHDINRVLCAYQTQSSAEIGG